MSIEHLVGVLSASNPEATTEEMADILWLALRMSQPIPPRQPIEDIASPLLQAPFEPLQNLPVPTIVADDIVEHPTPTTPTAAVRLPSQRQNSHKRSGAAGAWLRIPEASALPGALRIGRALRPLRRRVPSRTQFSLDEDATVHQIAEQEGLVLAVTRPTPTRWLDVILVVDESASMRIWQQTFNEFRRLIERHGAFRNVRTWGMVTEQAGEPGVWLHTGTGPAARRRQARRRGELIDPGQRRLILVVTDCIASAWHTGATAAVLDTWGHTNTVALIQVLPQHLWPRSALGKALPARLRALAAGAPNTHLVAKTFKVLSTSEHQRHVQMPILTLDPESITTLARLVAGEGGSEVTGCLLPLTRERHDQTYSINTGPATSSKGLTAVLRIDRFNQSASATARTLARQLALVDLTLPVIRHVAQTLRPVARQSHIAEVLLGGLLRETTPNAELYAADEVRYGFIVGVQEQLGLTVPLQERYRLLCDMSTVIGRRAGQPLTFDAIIKNPSATEGLDIDPANSEIARLSLAVLRSLGEAYTEIADQIGHQLDAPEQVANSSAPAPAAIDVSNLLAELLGINDSIVTVIASSNPQIPDLPPVDTSASVPADTDTVNTHSDEPVEQFSRDVVDIYLSPPVPLPAQDDKSPSALSARALVLSHEGLSFVGQVLQQIAPSLQFYHTEKAEPFMSVVRALAEEVEEIETAFATQRQRYDSLRQVFEKRTQAWLPLRVLNNWLRSRNLYDQIHALVDDIHALKADAEQANIHHEQLLSLPLDVAERARKLQRMIVESIQAHQDLIKQGLGGAPLSDTFNTITGLQHELQQLPGYLLTASDEEVLGSSTKTDITTAWQTLERIDSPITQHLSSFKRWNSQFTTCGQALATAHQEIKNTAHRLNEVPQSVNFEPIDARFAELRLTASQLSDRYQSLDVAQIRAFYQQTRAVTDSLRAIADEAIRIRGSFTSFRDHTFANSQTIRRITKRMQEVAEVKKLPMSWQESTRILDQAQQRTTDMNSIDTMRTPAQLAIHEQSAREVTATVQQLEAQVELVRQQRETLLGLWAELAFATPVQLAQIEQLQRQIAAYHSANWPANDQVATLLRDAQDLVQRRNNLQPDRLAGSIPEQQVEQLVANVRTFSQDRRAFDERSKRIATILETLRTHEQQAKKVLAATLSPLEKQSQALASMRTESKLNTSRDQLIKQIQHGRELNTEMNQPLKGKVIEKTNRITEWSTNSHNLAHTFRRELSLSLASTRKRLEQSIQEIRDVAQFQEERKLAEALEVLRATESRNHSNSQQDSMERLLQDCVMISAKIQNALQRIASLADWAKPIFVIRDEVLQHQKEAEDKFNHLNQIVSNSTHSWPPIEYIHLDTDNRIWKKLGKDIKSLSNSSSIITYQIASNHWQNACDVFSTRIDVNLNTIIQQQNAIKRLEQRMVYWGNTVDGFCDHQSDETLTQPLRARADSIRTRVDQLKHSHALHPISHEDAKLALEHIWFDAHQDVAIGLGRVVKITPAGNIPTISVI